MTATRNADLVVTDDAVERHHRCVENAVVRANLAYARASRGQFPHIRALVMAEAITNLVTSRRGPS